MSLVYNRARSSSLAMLALSAIAGVAGCGGRDDDGDDDDERPAVASASDSSTPAAVGAANRAPAGNTVAEGSRGAVAQSGTTWSFDGARAGEPPTGFSFGSVTGLLILDQRCSGTM